VIPASVDIEEGSTRIRTETPADQDSVRAVLVRAFGQVDEAELVDALRTDPAWIPELSVVAESCGGVVGHVLMTRIEVGERPALALAPLSVVPDEQRKGIGSQLVSEVIRRATASDEQLVVVLGNPSYYSQFGFVPAGTRGVTGPFEGAGAAFQVLPLKANPPRGQTRYPEPFGAPAGERG